MRKKRINPYFPETEPDILTFLATQLFKALEREDYLYKLLEKKGVLTAEDVQTLSDMADWERIPPMKSEIRDKALEHLDFVLHKDRESEQNDG